jgi:hypothetical protein
MLDHSSDVSLKHQFEALLELDAVIEWVKVCVRGGLTDILSESIRHRFKT